MSDSYKQILKNVSAIIAGYPTYQELFASTDKFVLFLLYTTKFQEHLYDYLVHKNDTPIAPYRIMVPTKLNGENVTFIFHDFSKTPKTIAEKLADAIFLKKTIFKQPINATILCMDGFYSCPNELKALCTGCLALMDCGIYPARPCFTTDSLDYGLREEDVPKLRSEFFEFLRESLVFETIDPRNLIWQLQPETRTMIMGYFKDFNKDIAVFARQVGDSIAPSESFDKTDITTQNQTYVRFQATNSFRFIKTKDMNSGVIQPADYLYIPDNLGEVFAQINTTMAGIYNDWLEIKQNNRLIEELKHLRGTKAVRHLMHVCRDNMRSIQTQEYVYLHIDERTQQLNEIRDRIEDYQNQVDYESDMFKRVLRARFENITTAMISSLATIHVDNFSQSLRKLDPWIGAKLLHLQQDTNLLAFLRNLKKKTDKYFGHSNAYMIKSWFLFYRQWVPGDWQDRLTGFGRSDQYWLTPEFEVDTTIVDENVTLAEFVTIVDFYLRESFEFLVKGFESYIRPTQYYFLVTIDRSKIEGFANSRSRNSSQFFDEWKQIAGYQSRVPVSFIEHLRVEWEERFTSDQFETVQQTFRASVKRAVTFMKDNLDFIKDKPRTNVIFAEISYNHPKVEIIAEQLQDLARPVFAEFAKSVVDRTIHHMITLESPKIDSVLDSLSNVLIAALRSRSEELVGWQNSQPYQKMITLKYSLTSYADFLDETQLIFESSFLKMPVEELEYLQTLQVRIENLENNAKLLPIDGGVNTRWNWGRGLRSVGNSVHCVQSSGVTEELSLLVFFAAFLILLKILCI